MIARALPKLPARAQAYLEAIIRMCSEDRHPISSIILFGSVATGGFSENASDVDLIFVLLDTASSEERRRLHDNVVRLETVHGFRESPARRPGALEALFEKATANHRSCFICTRADLISGSVRRILSVTAAQAFFVDRIVIPSILSSAITIWGEDLLPLISLPPIRRLDILKAFYALSNQVFVSAALYPLLPGATQYAMGALKRSVHNCYFCYHAKPAPLPQEVDFFLRRYGPNFTLERLLLLRRAYSPSFPFVVRCLPAIVRLHLRTALDAGFPPKA